MPASSATGTAPASTQVIVVGSSRWASPALLFTSYERMLPSGKSVHDS